MVTEVNAAFHPQGGRFLVKPYPKNTRSRRFKLDPDRVVAISAHVAAHGLQSSDLLFRFGTFLDTPVGDVAPHRLRPVEQLGLTEPNDVGRRYTHGTLSAYTAGRCRCVHCRAAFANYRAERRANCLDSPRGVRTRDTDGPATRLVRQQRLAPLVRRRRP